MGGGNLLKYFTRTYQVVEEEHTERWKDQFTLKPGSLIRLTFIGGDGVDVDRL